MRLVVVIMVAAWAVVGGCAAPGPWVRSSIAGVVTDAQCREWNPLVGMADGSLGERVETVASDSPLRRDAAGWSSVVGHVAPRERLVVLDRIDRRLRIFGRVVYDGGRWLKVQGSRGDVGWVPEDDVRELAGPCQMEDIAVIDGPGRSEHGLRGGRDSEQVGVPADPSLVPGGSQAWP